MNYETDIAVGINIVVLPKTHRHYELSVEYNKAKLAGNPPKVLWSNPFVDGTNWKEYHGNPDWDNNFCFMLQYPDNYEDREIQIVSRISQYTYREKTINIRNALTFSSTHRFAHNKPADTAVYVISLHTNCAFIETVAWLRSVYAPINHYIVFDNEVDYKNAIRTFENSGHTLQTA